MSVDPEQFYSEEVERIVQSGNRLLGSNFRISVDDCPELSKLIVTCNPPLPGRHAIESIPGPHGVEVPEPGPLKTGGQFKVTFNDSFTGKAYDEVVKWAMESVHADNRKNVRLWCTHELGPSELDMTYQHCFPELEDGEFDYSNKNTPAKFSLIIHFAMRLQTKKIGGSRSY